MLAKIFNIEYHLEVTHTADEKLCKGLVLSQFGCTIPLQSYRGKN